MPGARLPMRKIRDMLRLTAAGMSSRKIAASLSIGGTTVVDCRQRARAVGVGWPLPEDLSDVALEAWLFPASTALAAIKSRRTQADWPAIHRELKRPGVTLRLLWEEHRAVHPEGHGYSRFCELFRAWEGRLSPTMRQSHVAGEKLFVDYAGATLDVIDGTTGEVLNAQLFVATLGASSYTWAEATWTQGLGDWIGSHTRAFVFFGGVAGMLVSDNLKSGITKACFYDPEVNRSYAEMAAHYGTAIVPARPYKPRDKAKVEVAVLLATGWIIGKLRNRRFFSITELNDAIRDCVTTLNERVTRHLGASRRMLFDDVERTTLKPLPAEPYVYAEWKQCRVGLDYHVEVEKHFYSVPRTCGRRRTACTRRCASTCRRATSATPIGRRSGSSGRPARSAPRPRRWSRSSCASARTPSRASAPASASCGSSRVTGPSGWRPPAAGRWRSARDPTARSTQS
jgi:transposase